MSLDNPDLAIVLRAALAYIWHREQRNPESVAELDAAIDIDALVAAMDRLESETGT